MNYPIGALQQAGLQMPNHVNYVPVMRKDAKHCDTVGSNLFKCF